MSQTTLPTWEMGDIVSPSLPQPSQLYHLEPIGLDTPFVEGLGSYMLRLAEAHRVLPIRLAHYIRDNIAEKQHFPALTFQFDYAVNSNSGLAQRWVTALEALTLQRDMARLTMLPWSHLFATTSLMRKHLAWCPDCWREWRKDGIPLSIPLLWLVSIVSICPRHQRPLHSRCPLCGQTQPVVAGTCWLGYCAHCGGLLDADQAAEAPNNLPFTDTVWEQELWNAHSLGDLLAASSTLNMVLDESALARFVSQCITKLGQGNMSAAARFLGTSPNVLSEWQRHRCSRVNVRTFFSVCFRGGLTPLDAIVCGQVNAQTSTSEAIIQAETPQPRRYDWRKRLDKEKLASELDDIIAHNACPPPTIREVANRLGCSKETLIRHFPQRHRILLQRYLDYKSAQLQAKRENVAQILEQALTEWPPPTTAQIAERVGCATSYLFRYFYSQFQAISARSQAYKAALIQEKLERLRQALEKELASEEWPPPTTIEILARLQCEPKIAYEHCCEQCRALSARHLAYRRQQKEKRRQAMQAEVRRVVYEIHVEGLYPNRSLVAERLPKSSMMLDSEVRKAYHQTLRDLGYGDA
jgi:AcrR family transcriptional regulator